MMSAPRHSAARAHRGRLLAVLAISSGVLVIEVGAGIFANSLALLADAAHVFADVAGIGLSLGAVWLAGRPASARRTYGLYRAEMLAAVLNALLLFAVAAIILVEAWQRFDAPPEIASGPMLAAASLALFANLGSAWMLRGAQTESLNARGAYLEVLGDALGAGAVLIAALVIALTGVRAADAIASGLIGLFILPRSWGLLRDAIDVLLEATPKGVQLDEVRAHILEAPGVTDVHDLHAWTITSGLNVVSAHVIIDDPARGPDVLDHLCRCLAGQFDIEHSTFQLETRDRRRLEEVGHR